jgi:DNA mismatch repair protein MutH
MRRSYNQSDRDDVLRHAKKLLGKRLAELYSAAELAGTSGKGTLGNLVQVVHFGLPMDNRPEPDLAEAGVELKVTGLKRLSNGELRVKERLVLSIIDFESIVDESFQNSSFFAKNALILLISYL